MHNDMPQRHFLPAAFSHRPIRILLVGCGGSGSQMLMGLTALDTALRAISSRSMTTSSPRPILAVNPSTHAMSEPRRRAR